MGLSGMVERCHELENRMGEAELTEADCLLVSEWWDALNHQIKSFLQSSDEVVLDPEDFRSLEEDIQRCIPYPTLLERVRRLRLESTRARLGRLARQGEALAEKLGKGPVHVVVQAGGTRLCGDEWGEFLSLIHI